jgi:hypothetical protein
MQAANAVNCCRNYAALGWPAEAIGELPPQPASTPIAIIPANTGSARRVGARLDRDWQ